MKASTECVPSLCPMATARKRIGRRCNDVTNRIDAETPCNVNERNCARGNARRQLDLAVILVRLHVTQESSRATCCAESFLRDPHTVDGVALEAIVRDFLGCKINLICEFFTIKIRSSRSTSRLANCNRHLLETSMARVGRH